MFIIRLSKFFKEKKNHPGTETNLWTCKFLINIQWWLIYQQLKVSIYTNNCIFSLFESAFKSQKFNDLAITLRQHSVMASIRKSNFALPCKIQ